MKNYLIPVLLLTLLSQAKAQSISWSSDIGALVYKNCTTCHHSGGIAPFSMMTYQQAFNNRFKIRGTVTGKTMPPWPPDNKYRTHAFDRSLSVAEIEKFEKWIDAGAPSGDLTKAPTAPVYDNLGEIKNPDLTITTPKYVINSLFDEYRCFPDSTRLTKDMWMTALECIPSDPEIVHHVLIFRDKGNKSYSLDSKQDGPGYVCFGGSGTSDADLLAAWVPGQGAFKLPKGFGMKIPAKSNIIVQVHYPAGARGKSDQTKVKFKLTDQAQRETLLLPALNHEISLTNGPLVIPANTVKTFNQRFPMPFNVSLIGVAPHMHLLGKSIKTWAVGPDQKEIPLIHIPNWDFHWQGIYQFPKIQKLSAGTILHSEAVYDNTASNPHNPNTPPKEVSVGEATTDEMMITYFLFAQYLAGDENFIIDSVAVNKVTTSIKSIQSNTKKIAITPNPTFVSGNASILFTPNTNDNVCMQIFDVQGKVIYSTKKSYKSNVQENLVLPLQFLHHGVYLVKLQGNDWIATEKWLIQ